MAKGDIMTAPGTGHVGCLTDDQKKTLKEVWSIIFDIADSGVADVPESMVKEAEKEAKTDAGAKSATVQAAAKAGWFSSKNTKAREDAKTAGHGKGSVKISLEDLGLSVDQLRPILWDNAMGDHPGKENEREERMVWRCGGGRGGRRSLHLQSFWRVYLIDP